SQAAYHPVVRIQDGIVHPPHTDALLSVDILFPERCDLCRHFNPTIKLRYWILTLLLAVGTTQLADGTARSYSNRKSIYLPPVMYCRVKGIMRIVGISGSPRKAGNTEFLLNEALAAAAEQGFQTERLLCSE